MLKQKSLRRFAYFARISVIVLLIAGLIPGSGLASSPALSSSQQQGPIDSTGNNSGGGTQLIPDGQAPNAGITVLCYTTQTGNSDPCIRVARLFLSTTIIRDPASFPTDLSSYNVVYIGYGEGSTLSGLANELQTYVHAGGGLVISQPNLEGQVSIYPPGFEMYVASIYWPEYPNPPGPLEFTRVGVRHPILIGLTPKDLSGNFDTIPINRIGPNWTILAKSVNYPNVALAAGIYGTGRLVFHTGNVSSNSLVPGSDAYLRQMIEWAGTAIPRNGPDMRINAIEVTQAIQDLNNSVDLVANKRTYVRVHVSSPVAVTHVFASLTAKRGTTTLYPTLSPGNPGAEITVLPSPDRGQINDSFWFELPSSWITAGSLTLTAHLDPANVQGDPNLSNNVSSVTVTFQNSAPLLLRIFNVSYSVNGHTYQAAATDLDHLESWLRRAYPIPYLSVTRQNFTYPGTGLPNVDTLHSWLALIKILNVIFNHEDGRIVYYGMVADGGGFMRGKAAGIPSTIAAGPTGTNTWGWDTDGSYGDWYGGHEIGHTRGRYHAMFCGATGGAAYPYPNGRISPDLTGNTAIYGFDITTHAIYPPSWEDVMTYCSNEWVSDFTYEGIRSYLSSIGPLSVEPTVVAHQVLALSGLVDLSTNTGSLDSAYLMDITDTLSLPTPGTWTIALRDNTDKDLATYPFEPKQLTDSGETPGTPAVIGEVVPWVDGATKVVILHGSKVIDTRTASAHAPTVKIDAPQQGNELGNGPYTFKWTGSDADGNPLTYSLLYSHDNGANWDVLSTNLTTTQLTIDTGTLPGGGNVFVRVMASDGLLSGMDTVGPFYVPSKPPEVVIDSPAPGTVFSPGQLVTFEGHAYDLEDGTLPGSSLSWTSSLDGSLGTGNITSTVDLSTGTHVISLTATDSNAFTSVVTTTITVQSSTTPLTPNLDVAPLSMVQLIPQDSPAITQELTLRSSTAVSLTWTVNISGTVPWLGLSSTTGQTPSGLQVTFNPSGLAPGDYHADLTAQAAEAGNSPLTIPVTLTVLPPYRAFLPVIMTKK